VRSKVGELLVAVVGSVLGCVGAPVVLGAAGVGLAVVAVALTVRLGLGIAVVRVAEAWRAVLVLGTAG
jgi:hypothetical protein